MFKVFQQCRSLPTSRFLQSRSFHSSRFHPLSMKRLGWLGGGVGVLSCFSMLNLGQFKQIPNFSSLIPTAHASDRTLGITLHTEKKRLIVVGDVHGCVDELKELLTNLHYQPETDLVVFVGDLVGKGPKSVEVVEYVKDVLKAPCTKGNHEHYILEWKENVRGGKAKDFTGMSGTHREAAESLSEDQWLWLQNLPYYVDIPKFNAVVVHAGFAPGVPWEQQHTETLLYLRSVRKNGEVTSKIEPDAAPWASIWNGPRHVVFGHDARRGIQEYPLATGLDSGCCYGRQLSALVLPDNRIVSVQAKQTYSPPDVELKWKPEKEYVVSKK